MKIKGEIKIPHVYVLTFETQYELCMSFVRMQEFYERPKFRNKYFTLEEFVDYWAKEFGRGSFDYPKRWNGFNLPSKAIDKWYKIFTSVDFREKEEALVDAIYELIYKEYGNNGLLWTAKNNYYVIGVHKGSSEEDKQEVIDHESAHALYYLYPAYKRTVNKLLKNVPKKDYVAAEEMLVKMGYGKNVTRDEIQAYFSTHKPDEYSMLPLGKRDEFVKLFNDFKTKIKLVA